MWKMSGVEDDSVFLTAGITRRQLFDEFVLLMVAASMHAIETAGLRPEIENEVAQGLYDWMREQPDRTGPFLLAKIEDAIERYAKAAQQDREPSPSDNEFSELDLELVDRLMAFGEENESRARACLKLGVVVPKTFWPAQYASAVAVLCKANLVSTQ